MILLGYVFVIIKNSKFKFSDEDIEEIASDVFLTIWNNRENLDSNRKLSPYIAGIAKNLMLKKKRETKDSNENIDNFQNILYENINLNVEVEVNEKTKIIIEKLNGMKREDNDIFVYYYYFSKSVKDISKIMNISEIKVKSRLSRIRKKLKKELERRGYSYER